MASPSRLGRRRELAFAVDTARTCGAEARDNMEYAAAFRDARHRAYPLACELHTKNTRLLGSELLPDRLKPYGYERFGVTLSDTYSHLALKPRPGRSLCSGQCQDDDGTIRSLMHSDLQYFHRAVGNVSQMCRA
eukprot:scaffold195407_cov27-Prasinocladus_malaysianus.AAC.1